MAAQYVFYLAVIPIYRRECIAVLRHTLGGRVQFLTGLQHLDPTVTTGLDRDSYTRVHNISLFSHALLQLGGWRTALGAETTVLDLNPRSLTAWALLGARKIAKRRTLVWGHLHPRAGVESKTRGLRSRMRKLASGTILYGYDGVLPARAEVPGQPVWVAPNSLYLAATMVPAEGTCQSRRVLYVGRLVPDKKVDLAIRAIAEPQAYAASIELDVVGGGDERQMLESLATELDVRDRVRFHGSISEPHKLRALYASAACSISPGYAGLSLTQSLGFGVPILVADDEPHAPEIELARLGGVRYFSAGDCTALAALLVREVSNQGSQNRRALSDATKLGYSAEAMAEGLVTALTDVEQVLGADGWPIDEG